MLHSLQIENYALIHSLTIRFDNGFTVITGETGAGKSILLGALSLVLGNRADTGVLFDKSAKCFVEARFDISHLNLEDFFSSHDLDYDDDTVIRREVNEKGKSRAFVNDVPVTLSILKDLTDHLINIHSQQDTLLFNNAAFRLSMLDTFAHTQPLLAQYHQVYADYRQKTDALNKAEEQLRQLTEEQDYLSFMAEELRNAKLKNGEQEELESQIALLTHAEQIKQCLFDALQLLQEQDNSIISRLQEIKNSGNSITSIDDEIANLFGRLDSCIIDVKDIAYELEKKEEKIEVNPDLLDRLSQRLDFILSLQYKHHADSVSTLLQLLHETERKVNDYSDNQQLVSQLQQEKKNSFEQLVTIGNLLTEKRKSALLPFSRLIVEKIGALGMKDGNFITQLLPLENYSAEGRDRVSYLFTANKGGIPMEIEKVASGGELSRLMLALKSVINETTLLPTVVFDEIDTGISGAVAGKVAVMMKDVSLNHQLLVITHLPQIAAKANIHYYVYKEVVNGQTYSSMRLLSTTEREMEIAKMISGENISENVIKTAKELLSNKS